MMCKCCACDRALTVAECHVDAEMCPGCRAEHDAAYATNLAAERARLMGVLHVALYWAVARQEMASMGWVTWSIYTDKGEN